MKDYGSDRHVQVSVTLITRLLSVSVSIGWERRGFEKNPATGGKMLMI
jgi:hypothetical protein